MGRFFSLIFFLGFCFSNFVATQTLELWAAESQHESIKTFLLRGVEKGLNLEEKATVEELSKAIQLKPDHPAAYAYLAMAYLYFYETSFEEKDKNRKQALMARAIEDAQARGEKRIEKDPRDAEAYFSVAIARMVRNRWEILRKNYFRAFREAQSVWEYLERVRELDPGNYDVYYPMGVLHYYLAQLSGPARWIASMFITPGDREKGIKEFELAAEKGFMMKDLARSNLVSIYSGYEKQPAKALPLAMELKQKYPDNYNFSFGLINIYSDLGRFEEAINVARQIEEGIKKGAPPYRPELWPRYYQSLGKIYLDRREYEKATEYLNLALKDVSPYNARVRAWALVRLGMIHDARKDRKVAEEYYRKALEVEGAEGLAQRAAREYLDNPYSPSPQK